MKAWWRSACAVAVLSGASLVAQCPAHRTVPLAEVLLHDARTCSNASQTDALCPVNHEPEAPTAYAMFKDCATTKPDGYLVVPTEPVTGTEDSKLRADTYAKLWTDAWAWAQRFPKADAAWTGLAANSQCARTINQLHIHVSCVNAGVKKTLEAERESIPLHKDGDDKSYKAVELPLASSSDGEGKAVYRVVRVTELTATNPTTITDALTPHTKPQACSEKKLEPMGKQDIAVIGSAVQGEYFVLTYESGFANGGAEDLLDQTCKQAEAAGGRQ